ncbi:MAG TPA: GntG family PLP-dependent aldolase [Actinomycetota bacterium]|nr:GntG family PLP-dependent aldolase [Actinomycetota bacterium]
MPSIDLRSDTVTKPSAAMRRAMAEAEVGDDAWGDDPTVNRLQERAAEVTGKEAALYTATGMMANQTALRTFVRAGHEVVAEATAHVMTVEKNSAASLSGISYRPILADRGRVTPEQVSEALVPDPLGLKVVDLVAVENTHQVGGGTVLPLESLRGIRKVTTEAELPLYMDGARIWNASVASGVPVHEYAAEVDALMFCFSKGLGAPIGSVLCGPDEFIREARRVRVQLTGAWRQAGVIAAAALVALEEGPKRLHEDHENARRLATGVADELPGAVEPDDVETNIVFVDPTSLGMSAKETADRLKQAGVLVSIVGGRVRMLTHVDVTRDDVDAAIDAWRELATGRGR